MLDIQNACNQLAAYGMKRYQHSRQDEERAQLYRQNVDIDLYGTAEIYEMKISKITLAKAMQILAILSTIETGDSHNDHI